MIPVQIASQVTALGVQGLRWVLIDAADSPTVPAVPTVPTPPAVPTGNAPAASTAISDLPAAQPEPTLAAPGLTERPSMAVWTGPAPWGGLKLGLLKAGVAGIGLALALWLAGERLGPARVSWLTTSSATTAMLPPKPSPAPAIARQPPPPQPQPQQQQQQQQQPLAAGLSPAVTPMAAAPVPAEPGPTPRLETREAPPP